ncbi:hypothetical protein T484DRAFT_1755106 [Baffinella frigidus]|nr:hypothetical protein T484DRAFT_1755106 [Cryptophyta sp. CCMP2293]
MPGFPFIDEIDDDSDEAVTLQSPSQWLSMSQNAVTITRGDKLGVVDTAGDIVENEQGHEQGDIVENEQDVEDVEDVEDEEYDEYDEYEEGEEDEGDEGDERDEKEKNKTHKVARMVRRQPVSDTESEEVVSPVHTTRFQSPPSSIVRSDSGDFNEDSSPGDIFNTPVTCIEKSTQTETGYMKPVDTGNKYVTPDNDPDRGWKRCKTMS